MVLSAIWGMILPFLFYQVSDLYVCADCRADGDNPERETERDEAAEHRERFAQTQTGPEDTGQNEGFSSDSYSMCIIRQHCGAQDGVVILSQLQSLWYDPEILWSFQMFSRCLQGSLPCSSLLL